MDNLDRINFIKKLFGDHVEYTEDIDSHQSRKGDLVNIVVFRESVEKGSIQFYLNQYEKLEKKKDTFKGNVLFTFDGYDDDPREIYEIPEVKSWVNRFYKNKSNLFYFLHPELMPIIMLCLVEDLKKIGHVGAKTNVEVLPSVKPLIEKLVSNAMTHAKKLKESEVEKFKLANSILQGCQYDMF